MNLSSYGFGKKKIRGKNLSNLFLAQSDAHSLPIPDNSIDIGLSINIIDRTKNPHKIISDLHRVLKKDGLIVFSNPLNWIEEEKWLKYPDAESILKMFNEIGFKVEDWFDGLFYREIRDARGSFEEWKTLIIQARKT